MSSEDVWIIIIIVCVGVLNGCANGYKEEMMMLVTCCCTAAAAVNTAVIASHTSTHLGSRVLIHTHIHTYKYTLIHIRSYI